MKKYLALIVSMLLVLSFAAVAFAQMPAGTTSVVAKGDTQVALTGEIGMRGRYFKNLDLNDSDGSGGEKGNASMYQYHYALGVTATTGKVKGVIEFYSGKTGWLTWGKTSSTAEIGKPAEDDVTTGSLGPNFRQLFIEFPVLGVNVKVGHQLGQLGVASFLDFSKEGADALILSYPFGKNSVALGTIKVTEMNDVATTEGSPDKDTDIYFATGDFDLSGHGLGFNVAMVRNSDVATKKSNVLYNAGLTYKGKFGPLGLLAAFDKQFGDHGSDTAKVKYQGYHARLVANYAPINELTLSAASIYYSGDKGDTTDKSEGFTTYLEDKDYATFVYGYLVRGVQGGALTATSNYGPGVPVPAGTWFNRLAATYKPMKDLAVTGAFINLRGTYKNISAMSYNGSSKSIGNEIDMLISYDITKNLNYSIQGGILMPGKAWERSDTLKQDENAIAMQHVLMYKF
ncbi:MAG: hypothetical protein LLF28_05165 [Nitrospiraceae bacterium]|nr:hypothetical protein [Nitrospiraceae bacterium]